MTLRLYDSDISYLFLERDYDPASASSEGGIQEYTTRIGNPVGEGYYHEIYFEGVHIGFGNALLSNKVLLYFESDFETVEMHFALKGSSNATSGQLEKQIGFNAHQQNIIYANKLRGKMQWESEAIQLFEINLSPVFFNRFLPDDSKLFSDFRKIIDGGNAGCLNTNNKLITYQMYQIIDDIMNCQRKGFFKRMYLEAKVIELLVLQLEQSNDGKGSKVSLSKENIDKIYAVRDFILDNIHTASSLIDLAHRAGTNEFTLKKGFKELFGTTVFGFWSDTKMEQAKLMLTEQAVNISDVSKCLGYKNPRHFSTAFKRKYGFLPSQLKNYS